MTSIYSENNSPERIWASTTYPKPPPLSERSASQKNVQTLRLLHPEFGKTLFPKLPRSSRTNKVHVFEDELGHAPKGNTGIHPGPLVRQQQSHVGAHDHVAAGQENEGLAHLFPSKLPPSAAPAKPLYPEVQWPELPPVEVVGDRMRQSLDVPMFRPPTDGIVSKPARNSYSIFPSSGNKTPRISLGSTIGRTRSHSTTSTASYGLFPHLPDDFATAIAAATDSLERHRSTSSPQERPRSASSPVAPVDSNLQDSMQRIPSHSTMSASDGRTGSVGASASRTSSERSPSIGISTGRAVYPPPGTVQRKNVNPQIPNTSSPYELSQSRTNTSATGPPQAGVYRPRMNSNWSGFSGRQGAVSPVVEERSSYNGTTSRGTDDQRGNKSSRVHPRNASAPYGKRLSPRTSANNVRHGPGGYGGRVSPRPGYSSHHSGSSRNASSSQKASSTRSRLPSNGFGPRNGSFARNQFNPNPEMDHEEWPEEFGEVVPGLNFSHSKTFSSASRPSTSSSRGSGRGSLYKFLNDNYTSWAKLYYRNEAALHLEVPPPVAQIGISNTPPQSRAMPKPPSGASHVLRVPHGARLPMQQNPLPPPPVANFGRGRVPPRGTSQSTTASSIPEVFRMPRGPPPPRHFRPPQTSDSFASIDSRFTECTSASAVPKVLRAPRGPPFLANERLPATPEDHSENTNLSAAAGSDSPGSAGFPETVYVPRIRPVQQTSISVVTVESERSEEGHIANATPSVRESVEAPHEVSRFSDDRQSSDQDPIWRESDHKQDSGMFSIVNRQVFLFCLGFVFPIAWFIGALLPIPIRPEMRMIGHEDYYNSTPATVDLFDSMAVIRYQKARRWRTTNRFMSILGLCIIIIIGATAGVATRH